MNLYVDIGLSYTASKQIHKPLIPSSSSFPYAYNWLNSDGVKDGQTEPDRQRLITLWGIDFRGK